MEASMTGDETTTNKDISDVIEDIITQILSAHPESTTTSIIPTPPPTAEITPPPATITTTTTTSIIPTPSPPDEITPPPATIIATATTNNTESNGQSQLAVEQNGGSSVGSSSGERPKRKRRSSNIISDAESSEANESGGRTKRARTKTQLFQSPAQIGTRINRSASQSDFDETLSEKSKEDSQKKKVEYEKYQILAVRSESGFYLCRTAQGSRTNSDLKIEWLDSKDEKNYTLTKHFDKVAPASVLAELYLHKLKLPDQRSRTYILDDDSRNIIEKALKDSLKVGKDKADPCPAEIKLNDSKEELPSTRRRRSTRTS